ncbi:orange carotenoid protein N-terminal domain-containing protein [Leptolyngbya iicbica]|uniref:Orange carotenoid protein n=2 Tax=Cyanophyceae TaxID=3028117 RepID=A0A4Q7E7J6_9CYAN|nr:orange carotenoid protein N-terminal domain-containing protein [Leptolyngbya sp. LK]RZM76595.1 Orange carotenoid protein [Leptolyngbya sp. LK]
MTYATVKTLNNQTTSFNAVEATTKAIQQLTTDDQLGLLWTLYKNMGRSITPAAPGAARLQFAAGLLEQVQGMSHPLQLQFMRDLVENNNTPETRAYGVLTNNTKLAFWYQLAVLMEDGVVIPVPDYYQLSNAALRVFDDISRLEFGQQITVMRQAVVAMGVDPLA